MLRTILFAWILAGTLSAAHGGELELSSPTQQTLLLELYTSEGCSSCPPADRWLSQFKSDARLWRQIVPVAFHVDYWNYLGWRDRFSAAEYSARQRNYQQRGYLKGVYTPGLMTNGREWRSWFGIRRLPQPATTEVGVLKARIDAQTISAEFTPSQAMPQPLLLNVAFLGFDQSSEVASGENTGKKLLHDFVVLAWQQYPQRGDEPSWQLPGLETLRPADASGIALWLTRGDDPTPVQATGGWLQP